MKTIVNSNYNFYNKSLKVLLPSIIEAGSLSTGIEVVVGGSPWEYKKEVILGITHHFVNYDNVDLTSFIFLTEHPEVVNDVLYFFYLHDTTKMGKTFFIRLAEKMNKIISSFNNFENFKNNVNCIRLTSDGASMNIGVYKTDFITKDPEKVKYLNSIKNYDLSEKGRYNAKLVALSHEDYFLKHTSHSLSSSTREVANFSPYESDVPRIQEYYKEMDFYKYKSNCTSSPHLNLRERYKDKEFKWEINL